MSVKHHLSVLVMVLLVTGFLVNSVSMRVLGIVEGSLFFPVSILLINVVLALVLMSRINNKI